MVSRVTAVILAILIIFISEHKASGEGHNSVKRPNIVFIMTDDQSSIIPSQNDTEENSQMKSIRFQSHPFGFNGDNGVHTPVIDGLAKNGMIFTKAYVSSSVCSPSRYSTLTGRYAGRCEGNSFMSLFPYGTMAVVENNTELEEKSQNLPRLLQKVGYRTGFVGKSHVIDHHLLGYKNWEKGGLRLYDRGDDPKEERVTEAMIHNHNYWVNRIKEFGFDYVNSVYAANLLELFNDSLNSHNLEYRNQAALDFIEKSGEEPFFLYYSESVPHGPEPWRQTRGKFIFSLDAKPYFTSKGYYPGKFENMPDRHEIKKEVAQKGIDPRQGWLTWFDHAVGSVVNKLREVGKLENTLIVITSDHGNYNFAKSTLYEGGIKVPLMMYWTAGIKAGSVYNELVQNIDFTPTFLELAGVDLSLLDEIDGVSMKRVLGGNTEALHDHLFFEIGFARGVMTKNWKYIAVRYNEELKQKIEEGYSFTDWRGNRYKQPYYIKNSHLGYHAALLNENYFEADQLYDLKNDPHEKNNLQQTNTAELQEMKKLLVRSLKSFPGRPYAEFVE